jgi:hypothetical protein
MMQELQKAIGGCVREDPGRRVTMKGLEVQLLRIGQKLVQQQQQQQQQQISHP